MDQGHLSVLYYLIPTAVAGLWYALVSAIVPNPYLDEVFHVRQAQVYCSGAFGTWDPKITTPPGLYLLSYAVYYVTNACNINVLRFINVAFMSYLGKEIYDLLGRIYNVGNRANNNARLLESRRAYLAHTALNICLFPPLIFFSGVYYTDLAAVIFVLFALHAYYVQNESKSFHWLYAVVQIVLGLWSLALRQTNVFWVGLYPIGITVSRLSLDLQGTKENSASKNQSGMPAIEEYISSIVDVITTVLSNVPTFVINTWQYVLVITMFGLFVFWNGGVVLGDKANHVATVHLPQMLYIWPYIFFFSFPVILHRTFVFLGPNPIAGLRKSLPRLWILLSFTCLALLIIYFNTIVHPFTLADNRHYVFYVFRLLLRHPAIKYFAAPVYVVCGWLALSALIPPAKGTQVADPKSKMDTQRKSRILFTIVWIVTSAACLVTAPLVEPRYFIIPWITWRMAAAPWTESAHLNSSTRKKRSKEGNDGFIAWLRTPRAALWMETIWLLAVNAVTMYVFLFCGFEWKQEKGVVQRFMW